MIYGEGGSQGVGSYKPGSIAGRQDMFWIFALRLASLGNLTRETPTASYMALGDRKLGSALSSRRPSSWRLASHKG